MRDAVRTILIAWALLIGVSGSVPALAQEEASADPDRDRIERLVSQHAGNGRLQTERPEFQPEAPDFKPRQRNPFIEAIGDFFAWIFRNFGWLFQGLLIGAIACAVVYALWYMFGDMIALPRRRTAGRDGPDVSDIGTQLPDRGQATALLADADALAAEGKFAEAVHLLLFRSIEDLREHRAGGVPQSLTAREIHSLSDLTERTREALSPIIRIVENSFFGGKPVGRDGWQRARSSYEHFAFGGAS